MTGRRQGGSGPRPFNRPRRLRPAASDPQDGTESEDVSVPVENDSEGMASVEESAPPKLAGWVAGAAGGAGWGATPLTAWDTRSTFRFPTVVPSGIACRSDGSPEPVPPRRVASPMVAG